jgi:hypothetical protein
VLIVTPPMRLKSLMGRCIAGAKRVWKSTGKRKRPDVLAHVKPYPKRSYRDYITGKEVLQMDVENKMIVDDYWPDYEEDDEQESEWEKFCRMADEEYDESFFAWSRREDGYVL